MKTKKDIKKKPGEMEVCCPYFDAERKCCTNNDCIRMLGFECKYTNRKYSKYNKE